MSFIDSLIVAAPVSAKRQHLSLDRLFVIPSLVRRLPPEVAFRYYALPLAESNGCTTVAMADPEDSTARAAVAAALGTQLYVVQADLAVIKALLSEIWPELSQPHFKLLVCRQESPLTEEVTAYAGYVNQLLGGHVSDLQEVVCMDTTFQDVIAEAKRGYDLVVFGEPDQSLAERLLSGRADRKAAEQIPTSTLIARGPRWPLRRLLLITRGYEMDEVAVDWAVRLAQPSKAVVTVLGVLPDVPATYNQALRAGYGLLDWIATDTTFGRQMRRVAQRVENWATEGTLRFRQGPPDRQIQSEVSDGAYDLTVIAADPRSWWLRRLLGELVAPLLSSTNRPVLIAKPLSS